MTDQEVMTQMNALIRLEFDKNSIFQLSMEERMKLCLLLKRNFGAGVVVFVVDLGVAKEAGISPFFKDGSGYV